MTEQSPIPPRIPAAAADPLLFGPTPLGGNVTGAAHDELYDQKVDFMAKGVFRDQVDEMLELQRSNILMDIGGLEVAKTTEVWDKYRSDLASRERSGRGAVLSILETETAATAMDPDDQDTFDRIFWVIAKDLGPEGADLPTRIATTPFVQNELAQSEELNDPDVLARATKAIHLMVETGIYKLNRWEVSYQLDMALQVMEQLAKHVPDFDPRDAGFDDALNSLSLGQAALLLDFQAKPRDIATYEMRQLLLRGNSKRLGVLQRVRAHVCLRTEDVDPAKLGLVQQPVVETQEAAAPQRAEETSAPTRSEATVSTRPETPQPKRPLSRWAQLLIKSMEESGTE